MSTQTGSYTKGLIVPLLILTVLLVSYPHWGADMVKQSMEDIPVMQENDGHKSIAGALHGVQSSIAHGLLFAFLMGYYGGDLSNSGTGLFIFTTYFFIAWLGSLLQMLYHGQRPFWNSEADAKNLAGGCILTYGSPSVDVMLTTYLMLVLYLNYYYDVGEPPKQFASVMCTGYIIKMGITSFALTALIGLALANVFLGLNSYDQTLLGILLAVLFAFWFHFKLKIHFKLLPHYMSQKDVHRALCPWSSRQQTEQPMPAAQYSGRLNNQEHTYYPFNPAIAAAALVFLLLIPQLATHLAWSQHAPQRLSQVEVPADTVNDVVQSPLMFYKDGVNSADDMIYILQQCYSYGGPADAPMKGNSTRRLLKVRHNSHHEKSPAHVRPPKGEVSFAQHDILMGFHNQALLDGTGYAAALFGVVIGSLFELWRYQGRVLIAKKPSEWTQGEAKKSETGVMHVYRFKIGVTYMCLLIYFLLFTLVTDHTELLYKLYKPKEGEAPLTPEYLHEAFMDSLLQRTFFNEFTLKFFQYFLLFGFGKSLFASMMQFEIGYQIHRKRHEQFLLDLKQMETDHYADREDRNLNDESMDSDPVDDFDAPHMVKQMDRSALSSSTTTSQRSMGQREVQLQEI